MVKLFEEEKCINSSQCDLFSRNNGAAGGDVDGNDDSNDSDEKNNNNIIDITTAATAVTDNDNDHSIKLSERKSSLSLKRTCNHPRKQQELEGDFSILSSGYNFNLPLDSTMSSIPVEVLAQLTSASSSSTSSSSFSSTVINNCQNCVGPNDRKITVENKKRKSFKFKPSNVWNHFLRLSDGNVQCIHCAKILKRKDSSTKTMWGHLRAIHYKGRDWTALQQQAARDRNRHLADPADLLALQDEPDPGGTLVTSSTQSWLEQQVGIGNSDPTTTVPSASSSSSSISPLKENGQSVDSCTVNNNCNNSANGEVIGKKRSNSNSISSTPTHHHSKRNRSASSLTNISANAKSKNSDQNAKNIDGLNAVRAALAQPLSAIEEKSTNFLSSIPHTAEVINISAGYAGDDEQQQQQQHRLGCSEKPEKNDDTECNSDFIPTIGMNNLDSPSPVVSQINIGDHSGPSSHSSLPVIAPIFSIFDGDLLVILMRVASDLDCTLSFHRRGGRPQLCFESNRTACSKMGGPVVCLFEAETAVHILVHTDGTDIDSEYWKKTDKAQFMWAVRGICQKVFTL